MTASTDLDLLVVTRPGSYRPQGGRPYQAAFVLLSSLVVALLAHQAWGQGPGGCTAASFVMTPTPNMPPAQWPDGPGAVADFNSDGIPDVAFGLQNTGGGCVLVGISNGSGGFTTTSCLPSPVKPTAVVAADFDLDGIPDIAGVDAVQGTSKAWIRLGNGAGGFGPLAEFNVGSLAMDVAVGDVNLDGKPDLVVANLTDVSVLLGTGNGGMLPQTIYSAGLFLNTGAVAVGDLDYDGNPDIVVGFQMNAVSILMGQGNGIFNTTPAIVINGLPPGIQSLELADLNQDGAMDIVAGPMSLFSSLIVILADGTGGFLPPVSYGAPNQVNDLAVEDFNLDGILDIATAKGAGPNPAAPPGRVFMFLGDGSGGFSGPLQVASSPGKIVLAAGDFDLDQKPDLAFYNSNSPNLASPILGTLLNACSQFSLTITQPDGPGGEVSVTNHNLVPTNVYHNIFSFTPCAGPVGSGQYLGLCSPNPAGLIAQALMPLPTPPFHFTATAEFAWFGPYTLSPVTVEGVSIEVLPSGTLNAVSGVTRRVIY